MSLALRAHSLWKSYAVGVAGCSARIWVLRGATLIGLVIVCVLVVLTVLAAAFYNLFSELTGGLEVMVVEHEDER